VAVVTDTWNRTDKQQFQFSGYFRTYSLRLLSNFGDGLIRQSEFRTAAGGDTSFVFQPRSDFSFLAGVDVRRDAPRNLNLDRADPTGVFQRATSNNLTISSFSPFAAVGGKITPSVQYSLESAATSFCSTTTTCFCPPSLTADSPGLPARKPPLRSLRLPNSISP
jgi:hypothetical protein